MALTLDKLRSTEAYKRLSPSEQGIVSSKYIQDLFARNPKLQSLPREDQQKIVYGELFSQGELEEKQKREKELSKPTVYSELASPLLSGASTFASAGLLKEGLGKYSKEAKELMFPEQKTLGGKTLRFAAETAGFLTGLPEQVIARTISKHVVPKLGGKFIAKNFVGNLASKSLKGTTTLGRVLEHAGTGAAGMASLAPENLDLRKYPEQVAIGGAFGAGVGTALEGAKSVKPSLFKGSQAIYSSFVPKLKRFFSYSKNPGRGMAREKIHYNNLEEAPKAIQDVLDVRTKEMQDLVSSRNEKVSLSKDINEILMKEKEKAISQNNQTLLNGIYKIEDSLKNHLTIDEKSQQIVKGVERKLDDISLREALDLKRTIGDVTTFTGNPSDFKPLNALKIKLYGKVKDAMNKVVPELEEKNETIADLIGAKNAAQYSLDVKMKNHFLGLGAPSKIASAASVGLYVLSHNPASVIPAVGMIGLEKMLKNPAIMTRLAGTLSKMSEADISMILNKSPKLKVAFSNIFNNLKNVPREERVKILKEYPELSEGIRFTLQQEFGKAGKISEEGQKLLANPNKIYGKGFTATLPEKREPFLKELPAMRTTPEPEAGEGLKDPFLKELWEDVSGKLKSEKGQLSIGKAKAEEKSPEVSSLGFYSQAEKSIQNLPMEKMSGQQLGAMLQKAGVKPEEMEWTGLNDLVKKPSVTKQEALDTWKSNQIQVEEKVLESSPAKKEAYDKYNNYVRNLKEKYDPSGRMNLQSIIDLGKLSIEEKYKLAQLNDDIRFGGLTPAQQRKLDRLRNIANEGNLTQSQSAEYDYLANLENVGFKNEDRTKFSKWQLPGGENYREVLLTLQKQPLKPNENITVGGKPAQFIEDSDGQRALVRINGEGRAVVNYTQIERSNRDFLNQSHWDEPNVLAHIRVNDRMVDGKKVLFIEEVQSDWHQKGREEGYKQNLSLEQLERNGWKVVPSEGSKNVVRVFSPDGKLKYAGHKSNIDLENLNQDYGKVPDAPFKKNWHELAMKRMLKYASDNGYDKVAWTRGEQQAERYDLSKKVNSIRWQQMDQGRKAIRIEPKNHGVIDIIINKEGVAKSANIASSDLEGKRLEDIVGKDIADKIMSKDEDTISGQGLKVGGEGMKGFYDQIVPYSMNKLTKKWGGRVGEIEIPTENKISEKAHSIDITPEMRSGVKGGLPLFSAAPVIELANIKNDKDQQDYNFKHIIASEGGIQRKKIEVISNGKVQIREGKIISNGGIEIPTLEEFNRKNDKRYKIDSLNINQKREIFDWYFKNYKPKATGILDLIIKDDAFHWGKNMGVRHIQRAIGTKVDGAWGPKSQKALEDFLDKKDGKNLLSTRLINIQRSYMKTKDNYKKNKEGWENRLKRLENLI